MADTKLSALPSATSLSGAKIYGTQGGSSKAFSAELFGAVLVGTRTALKALDTALAQAAFLTEAGREGVTNADTNASAVNAVSTEGLGRGGAEVGVAAAAPAEAGSAAEAALSGAGRGHEL